MTTTRKSFLLHFDSLEILDELTNEQCGLLFKACRDFNIGGEVTLDPVLSLVFFSFKKQFERDQVKYKAASEKNKLNGSKGGRPKNPKNPKKPVKPKEPSGLNGNPVEPKKADSDNDSGNDNESGNESESDKEVTVCRFDEFWNLYDKKTGLPKCKAKFSKLADSDIELIFKNLPAYVASTPNKKFRKNPEVWINNQCWHDEIIKESVDAKSTHSFESQNYQSGSF